MMNTLEARIVPAMPDDANGSLSHDCKVATRMLQNIMMENPGMTPSAAYERVQQNLARVSILPWTRMKLVLN